MRYVLYFIAFILMFIAFCLWTMGYILWTFRPVPTIKIKAAWFEMKHVLNHGVFPDDKEYPRECDYWIKWIFLCPVD